MAATQISQNAMLDRVAWLEAELALKQGRLERLEMEFHHERQQANELRNACIALQSTRPYGVPVHQMEASGMGGHMHHGHNPEEMMHALGSWCQAASGFMLQEWEARQSVGLEQETHEQEQVEGELWKLLAERKEYEDRLRHAERKLAERETLLRDVVRRLEEANSMLRQKERELQKFRARDQGEAQGTSYAAAQSAGLSALCRGCHEAQQVIVRLMRAEEEVGERERKILEREREGERRERGEGEREGEREGETAAPPARGHRRESGSNPLVQATRYGARQFLCHVRYCGMP